MISVIMPTMWIADGLLDRLWQLSKIEEVGEIILIDNSDTPQTEPPLGIPKLRHIREGRNTFVNPAWNKGVRLAKFARLCIMNDDISFDPTIFRLVQPYIKRDIGMIGLDEFDGVPVYTEDRVFRVVPSNWWRGMGYACLFFIHKSRYVKIPDELKIWYGDDYLFWFNGAENYKMQNVNVWGKPSTTSGSSVFDDVKISDSESYAKIKGLNK